MSNYPPDPQYTNAGQESLAPPPQQPLPAGPLPTAPMYYQAVDKDTSDLKMLSVFWYILAGLQAFGACFFLIYIVFGLLFAVLGAAGGASSNDAGAAAVGVGFGGIFVCFGVVLLAIAATIAYLNYKTGKSLVARKNITLIYIMAALVCIWIPLGTLLGIFTFITLNRPSIRATFT